MLNRLLSTGEKATTDRSDFVKATFTEFRGAGLFGSIPRSRTHAALFQRWSGWIYAAVMINARGVAGLPLRLYTSKPDNTGSKSIDHARRAYLSGKMLDRPSKSVLMRSANASEDIEEVSSHPILELLQQPNPMMSGYDASTLRSINLQVTGNAYLHIIENAFGFPAELWPMASPLVEIIPDSTGQIIAGYAYGRSPDRVEFSFDEVAHQRIVNPLDPFYGRGWVDAALTSADILDAMDEYELALFDNHARPDWAILVKEQMSDQEYARLEKQIDKKLRGRKRSGRPMVFEGGIDAKPLQFAPRDLAFTEGANRMVEKIAAISGVPVTKLKANDPNRANAESGALDWLRGTILPYAILDEEYLNNDILSRFDPTGDLFLAYDNPVPEDSAARSSQAVSDIQAGIRTRNEVRSEMGLPPIEGGDTLLVPAGMVSVENAGEPPAPGGFPGGFLDLSPDLVESNTPIVEDSPSLLASSRSERQIPHSDYENAGETIVGGLQSDSGDIEDCQCCGDKILDWFEFYTTKNLGQKAPAKDAAQLEYERKLRKYNKLIEAFRDEIGQAFESEIDDFISHDLDLESTVGTKAQADKIAQILKSLYTGVMDLSGTEAIAELPVPGASWSIDQPSVVNFIDQQTVKLANQINNSTKVALRNMMGTGIEEGETIGELTKRVQEWASTDGDDDRSVKWRAERIARTETARAHGYGRKEGWKQSSVVVGQKWIAAEGACQFCEAMNDKIIPIDGAFLSSGAVVPGKGNAKLKIRGSAVEAEPLHPNCRCHTDPVLVDDDEADKV